ncbi:hypothetical protein LNV09_05125 [Paucibacter sp. B2R-40]|uniref:hypothetical protein n=1 Tax=Paucibacter sp. B2R-40 TaxID=2893554 RepID=UPI0021E4D444|nr:hypothetical protein [Paucibacter sp. B2R-40]MCV2353540.1 hypothetical protein [Paucibacter sp. B2R-40]
MDQSTFFARSAWLRRGQRLAPTLALALCGSFSAHAINTIVDQDAAKPLQCLTMSEPPPVYPEQDLSLQRGGNFRVKLSFADADRAPEVEILSRNGSDDLAYEVRRYLRGYRLPCLASGQKIEAVQEFAFSPKGGQPVHWNDMRYVAPPANASLVSCLRTPAEVPQWREENPLASNIKKPTSGNVLLHIRFIKPDAAPEVTIAYSSSSQAMARLAQDHAREYRLPCLPAEAQPVTIEQMFSFRGSSRSYDYTLKDNSLMAFLGSVKDIDKQKVSFDLNTMACPFKVMWAVGQPAFKNRVGEVGEPNLNRVEFLAWLEGLTLNLRREVFDQVLTQSIIIDVPCGTIDLSR